MTFVQRNRLRAALAVLLAAVSVLVLLTRLHYAPVLAQLAAEGMTLILVTHEMNFAREVGDRVVFMHQGRVWEQGDSKTLFASPQTSELKQFISSVRGLN